MMTFVTVVSLLVGIAIGWILRTIQFVRDHDCANPDHRGQK